MLFFVTYTTRKFHHSISFAQSLKNATGSLPPGQEGYPTLTRLHVKKCVAQKLAYKLGCSSYSYIQYYGHERKHVS